MLLGAQAQRPAGVFAHKQLAEPSARTSECESTNEGVLGGNRDPGSVAVSEKVMPMGALSGLAVRLSPPRSRSPVLCIVSQLVVSMAKGLHLNQGFIARKPLPLGQACFRNP